ncbi:MAG: REP-associated tyrosine transposase [Rhodanobacteraceae bacterium]
MPVLHTVFLMPNYRRAWTPGATWFFTVNLVTRRGNDLLVRRIDLLRECVARVKSLHPFRIDAWVVLPEHMHCIWTLPADDADYPMRWRLIKTRFSRRLPANEYRSATRAARGERGIWQRRYWEHMIRDETDMRRHMDYVHINPVKHGWTNRVVDWPHSSFHAWVAKDVYPSDWAEDTELRVHGDE